MVKVKICGITNVEDARDAVLSGCDAIGFGFFRKSPRYVTAAQASKIVKVLPRGVIKIGVFVNAREQTIKRIAKLCRLDILQFHGSESPEFCARFKGYKVMKVFRVKDAIDITRISRYKTFAYFFDTFVPDKPGGTGETFDWRLLRFLETVKQPIFLSGGLNERNVKRAILTAQPDWVDVCSSVEIIPGKKDRVKVKRFIAAAKAAKK